ncbi:MAG: metal-dependent hydrolase [Gemmatimonadetes bacterium]|nr:metal-dependent hydrolase [Gemmatimonadota bacterium]
MTTVAHALSAALIAVTAMKVPPSETRYLVAALAAGAIADADHVYPVLRDWRFYRQHGFRGNLHAARTPVHELAGLTGAGIVACLLWWVDPLMAGVVFAAFAVHLAQDFVTGHSLPLNPADRTVVRMFDLSFGQKVAIDGAVIAISIALWIPYLRGRG